MPKLRSAELRRQLFECYSKNLSVFDPDLEGKFACPLCLRLFGVEALEDESLNIGHVIPKALGGRLVTLTCKQCDSELGYSADSSLVHQMRYQTWLAGQSDAAVRGRFRIGCGEMSADLYIRDDGHPRVEVHGIKDLSNPEKHAAVVSALKHGDHRAFSFRATSRSNFGLHRSRAAILKAAYLLMFTQFGYGYILGESVQQVREQISQPAENTILSSAVVELDDFPIRRNAVTLVAAPDELRSFLVTLQLTSDPVRHAAVIMPGLGRESVGTYTRWQPIVDSGHTPEITIIELTLDLHQVCDPEQASFVDWVWYELSKKV